MWEALSCVKRPTQICRDRSECMHVMTGRTGGKKGKSPGPASGHEDQHPPNTRQAILEGGESQEGQLGSALQGHDRQEPPAPGRPIGADLWV